MLQWFNSSASLVASISSLNSEEFERFSSRLFDRFSESFFQSSVMSIAALSKARSDESDGLNISLMDSTLDTELNSCRDAPDVAIGVEVVFACFVNCFPLFSTNFI